MHYRWFEGVGLDFGQRLFTLFCAGGCAWVYVGRGVLLDAGCLLVLFVGMIYWILCDEVVWANLINLEVCGST